MPRHEFRPSQLITGLAFVLAGAVYGGDAAGLWNAPWFVGIPIVLGGLGLAGAAGALTENVRRRRRCHEDAGARTNRA